MIRCENEIPTDRDKNVRYVCLAPWATYCRKCNRYLCAECSKNSRCTGGEVFHQLENLANRKAAA